MINIMYSSFSENQRTFNNFVYYSYWKNKMQNFINLIKTSSKQKRQHFPLIKSGGLNRVTLKLV